MKKFLMPLAIVALSVGTMQAGIATATFADIGQPKANNSITGDINSSTIFQVGNLFLTFGGGALAGIGSHSFGTVVFDITVGTSFSISDPSSGGFGSFTSTSITKDPSTPGEQAFYILGNYSSGASSFQPNVAPEAASFTFSFTQNPANTGGISDSSTFSDPPAGDPGNPTPEPATMALMGSALLCVGVARRRRKA